MPLRRDISTSWLATCWKWSKAGASKQLEEQERTAQAKLQTKRGADEEVAPEDQLEDKHKEAAIAGVCREIPTVSMSDYFRTAALLFTERFFPRFLSIPAFVFDDFGGAGFLVSFSVYCYSLEVVERLLEVRVKLLVYEDFWRNLIERSLIFVRFRTSWKWSKAGSSKQLEEQERTAQAKLQTKRGAYAEVAPEDQLEDKNKEAGEEKERALKELMKQPA
ncbi:hypothetical protein F511_31670 [Dorcoceras hygrometricum]|uniref:Uncharacterized protein n=1 Tax=Dorcoceras hygrometricum TaxID=472368 RepID=A0A2Z7D625_9LAMI|nr:hypothetical protein F511_31670 [Dorcoceras hygrometricum]